MLNGLKPNKQTISYAFPSGRKIDELLGVQRAELCSLCLGLEKAPARVRGRVPFSTHLITVLTRFSLINDSHQMPSCGRMTSGSLADSPGNSVNDFGDGSWCVMQLSLLSGLHYPLQHLFTLSSNSLLILILWNLDTFIQICPTPFMALTCQSFNIFSSAPVHFHRVVNVLHSQFVFSLGTQRGRFLSSGKKFFSNQPNYIF